MAEICHFYPGYTIERLMRTPIPVIRALHENIPHLLKLKGLVE